MRAVVQRVTEASVAVDGAQVGAIRRGYLVLLGVAVDDTDADARAMAEKLAGLRVFEDEAGAMNRSIVEAGGAMLIVSQFTLLGDVRKGRRPSFITAARGEEARSRYEAVVALVRAAGIPAATGVFGAKMQVALVNEGPVTILVDTRRVF